MNHPLSRKQLWRRQTKSTSNPEREGHDFFFRNGINDGTNEVVTRTQSLPTVGTVFNFYGLGQHVWGTTGNLSALEDHKQSLTYRKKEKKVAFRKTVKISLIPGRAEYQRIDVTNEMWWDETDYSAFKKSAIIELKAIMSSRNYDSKQAQEVLYQPGFHVELDLNDPTSTTYIPSHSLIFGEPDVGNAHKVLSPFSPKEDDDVQQHTNNSATTM